MSYMSYMKETHVFNHNYGNYLPTRVSVNCNVLFSTCKTGAT
jgi:hypothetical protein